MPRGTPAEMLEPRYLPLTAYPDAWSAATAGEITGAPLVTARMPYDSLAAMRAKLTGAIVLSRHWDISLATFFTRLTSDLAVRLMTAMFSPMDLLFYALAVWQGYKLSIIRPAAR